MPLDKLDDAFSEWDENKPIAPFPRSSQSHAIPTISRTVTLKDPTTTAALARATRIASPPATLEEALLAFANGIPELLGC